MKIYTNTYNSLPLKQIRPARLKRLGTPWIHFHSMIEMTFAIQLPAGTGEGVML
jgi:hypothetical protein